MKVKKSNFEGVFFINGKIATINSIPGYRPFNEEVVKIKDTEYRIWDPYKSKPSAAIKRGIKIFPFWKGMKILYLGIAAAKTATYLCNIIGKEGLIYGIDIAPEVLREAIFVSEQYRNIICILGDARRPEDYEHLILEKVDAIYEDIADPDQIKILLRNSEKFLKNKGFAMIAIKSQSINSVKPPKQVYKECLEELSKHFEILDKVELDPFEKNHLFIVMRMK